MVRTRSSAPADRVYSSPLPQQQLKFPARRQHIQREISDSSKELLRQSTLTQLSYVSSGKTVEELDADVEEFEREDRARKSKRRRTYGGKSSLSSRHHTQTLTQIDFVTMARSVEVGDNIVIRESPEAFNSDTGASKRSFTGRIEVQDTQEIDDEEISRTYSASPAASLSTQAMPPPETPAKRRTLEIPSSQSPATPFSIRSTRSESRSPLKEKTTNSTMSGRSPGIKSSPQKLPKLEIEDTFEWENEESQLSRIPSSPKRSSPKSVRFAARPDSVVPSTPIATPKQEPCSSPLISHTSTITKTEILDSEADDDDEPETCYDEFGVETEMQAARLFSTPIGASSTPNPTNLSLSTQSHPSEHHDFTLTQLSQAEESQRLAKHEIDAMAERTPRSDIIVSIYPGHIANIANGSKNHEFRDWPIPSQVARVWFYETKPSSQLRYMAVISNAKRPGGIENINGIGNKEFNASKKINRRAYEILELYQLATPIPLGELVRNEVLRSAPQKFIYILPATLDDLMSRLEKRVLPPPSSRTGHDSSDSQEANAQLRSTIQQFTPVRNYHSHPRSSQATTVDLTQPETPSQAASIQLVPDSPIVQVAESQSLPTGNQDMCEIMEDIVPFSLGSSQLLTKSQMLPASLMEDSGPSHRLYIEDSEDEDDMLW